MGTYDRAQICLNGHLINDRAYGYPEHNKKFCSSCGAETIMSCPSCNTAIKGHYSVPGVISLGERFHAPRFCESCGDPFPWTLRKRKAAEELIEFSELEEQEKDDLKGSIGDLIEGGPKTSLATLKFKKYAGKAGSVLGGGLKDILTDILSEAVKKAIWG